ncbi:MAG: FKBP-type peptidyl-prolyl cis-trans isomerase [Rhodothermales bacterium]|jgi:FKBP-type peptidyl-prolyl cis-trans isomerase
MKKAQIGLTVLLSVGLMACESPKSGDAEADQPMQMKQDTQTEGAAVVTELMKDDVVVGEGAEAVAGKTAVVHYTGWLYDPSAPDNKGKKFDSSRDRGEPFSFPLGAGRVIQGWDEGVVGMKVGGQRMLTIPASMGYGDRGAGGVIPPGATLLFDVELLDVQ